MCSGVLSVLTFLLILPHPSLPPGACQTIKRCCQRLIISLPTKNKQNIKRTNSTQGPGLISFPPLTSLACSFCNSSFRLLRLLGSYLICSAVLELILFLRVVFLMTALFIPAPVAARGPDRSHRGAGGGGDRAIKQERAASARCTAGRTC